MRLVSSKKRAMSAFCCSSLRSLRKSSANLVEPLRREVARFPGGEVVAVGAGRSSRAPNEDSCNDDERDDRRHRTNSARLRARGQPGAVRTRGGIHPPYRQPLASSKAGDRRDGIIAPQWRRRSAAGRLAAGAGDNADDATETAGLGPRLARVSPRQRCSCPYSRWCLPSLPVQSSFSAAMAARTIPATRHSPLSYCHSATMPAWFLFTVAMFWRRGQSVGQYLIGLEVTRDDGGVPSNGQIVAYWLLPPSPHLSIRSWQSSGPMRHTRACCIPACCC